MRALRFDNPVHVLVYSDLPVEGFQRHLAPASKQHLRLYRLCTHGAYAQITVSGAFGLCCGGCFSGVAAAILNDVHNTLRLAGSGMLWSRSSGWIHDLRRVLDEKIHTLSRWSLKFGHLWEPIFIKTWESANRDQWVILVVEELEQHGKPQVC